MGDISRWWEEIAKGEENKKRQRKLGGDLASLMILPDGEKSEHPSGRC